MPLSSNTAELQAWRTARPTRFRALTAYTLTVRMLAGYAWLRLWRPLLGPERYDGLLIERHRKNSRRLTRAILELGGLFIKVGQLISILTNFLPPEFRAELEQLQDSVPARPLDEVRARIRKEFGQPPETLFASFDPVPIASASLAQVHTAVTTDGRRVAVKVQHADIEAISRLDLAILGRVLRLVQLVVRLRGLESYHADISRLIGEELDFAQEARNIETIRANFTTSLDVHFPVVVPELSTTRVLTTELVDGVKATDAEWLDEHGVDRPALAERILRAYCQMMFVDGVFHADPHPGNILVGADGGITFIDFGAVGRMAPGLKRGVPSFWDAVIRRDPAKITGALREMGLIARDPALGETDVAERVIGYFQKRFLEQLTLESFALKDIQIDMRTKLEAMADLKRLDVSFRNLSRTFQVPKEWVIFERAAILLLGLCTQIDPNMNPIRTVGPYLEEFVLGTETDWSGQLASTLRGMAATAVALPEKFDRIADRVDRGEVAFRINSLPESALLLYAAAHQLLFAFVGTAAGVLAYSLEARGDVLPGKIAWGATALCFLGVVASMVRARATRRSLTARAARR